MEIDKTVNEPKDQDRAFDLLDHFDRFGCCMFPQQRKIYELIAESSELAYSRVVEVGCGSGLGTAIIYQYGTSLEIIGTDKLDRNVEFARQLYPWITFLRWDVHWGTVEGPVDEIVCVEVLEHLGNPVAALHNMLQTARCGMWLSTPNGRGKPRPPENPYHVCEYTPDEVIDMIRSCGDYEVEIYSWEDITSLLRTTTDVSPLIYRINK